MALNASRAMKKAGETPEELLRRFLPPMLATLAAGVPKQEGEWLYELKYDGFRALTASSGGDLAMWSRNGLDLSARFPSIFAALEPLAKVQAVIDGEIVALDANGIPRFQLLQRGDSTSMFYFVFDLLWLNGHDLRREPIEHRRELLEEMMRGVFGSRSKRNPIRIAERITQPAEQALHNAASAGFEGLIAKRKGSLYETRRSKEWIKLKALSGQEFAIVGFTPSTHSSSEIGALLLGVVENGKMRFAGKVGTGFSAKLRVDLQRELSKDALEKPAVADAPRMRGATWVKPRLVAQVKFTEWTSDGKLRHPSFLGLRADKSPEEAVREVPAAVAEERKSASETSRQPAKTASPTKQEQQNASPVVLTHPERVLYPRDGITKQDVADYYDAMAEPMIRALSGRPVALEHWNQGIDKPSWFHQDTGRDAEGWMTVVDTPTRTSRRSVRHLVVDRRETLRWLAQRSVLTIHMWSSREPELESPDWVVFDLDPAKGKGIDQAVETAIVLRRLFEDLEIPSVPKTSGKRGIHVLVPLAPGHTHEEAADWAWKLASAVSSKLPFTTMERAIARRRGRLYFDCLQNGYGKTIVSPYSLRAIDGAPVSAPLKWSEVTKKLDPSRFNLRTMPARLAKVGDLFAKVFEEGIRLPKLK